MSISSKRIGSISALFNAKCCKIGNVSGHRTGLIIICYMNEAKQWKILFWSYFLSFLCMKFSPIQIFIFCKLVMQMTHTFILLC